MRYLPKSTYLPQNTIVPVVAVRSFKFSPYSILWSNLTWKIRSKSPYTAYSITYRTLDSVRFELVMRDRNWSHGCLSSVETNFTFGVYDIEIGTFFSSMNPNSVFGFYLV